jgi:glycosyltransferase 2 family protein
LKYIRTILFVLILAAIGWFVQATDWLKVADALQLVGWKFVWLLVATFLAAVCGAVGWQYCLGDAGRKVHFYDLFLIRHIGETVGLVNPTGMVGGEALKAAMLHTKGVDRRTVVVSVVVSRALTIVTQLILFVVVVLFLYHQAVWLWLVQLSGRVWILVGTAIFICWYFIRSGGSFLPKKALKYIFQQLPLFWQKAVSSLRESLHLVTTQQRAALLWASVYLTLHWLFGGLEFYLILRFIGADVTLLQAIFVDMGVVFFKVAGTMVPGQIGVEEYGNKVMLETIGLSGPEVWVTASILRRARQLFWIGFGLLTYFIYYHKWRISPSAE